MRGSAKKPSDRAAILQAIKTPPPGGYFIWDGKDEDDRPLNAQDMRAGMVNKRPGRPAGSNKESTTIRFDREVLEAFRAAGPGWQSRINAALKDWLKSHNPA
ncbi:MAG: BrnA antitoxin family protein [Acidobacteriaceae bacterium]